VHTSVLLASGCHTNHDNRVTTRPDAALSCLCGPMKSPYQPLSRVFGLYEMSPRNVPKTICGGARPQALSHLILHRDNGLLPFMMVWSEIECTQEPPVIIGPKTIRAGFLGCNHIGRQARHAFSPSAIQGQAAARSSGK